MLSQKEILQHIQPKCETATPNTVANTLFVRRVGLADRKNINALCKAVVSRKRTRQTHLDDQCPIGKLCQQILRLERDLETL